MNCPDCGSGVSTNRLSCPVCQRLLHRDELEDLAVEAKRARENGAVEDEISAWRQALELLPQNSSQYESIAQRAAELSRRLDRGPPRTSESGANERSRLGDTKTLRRHWKWTGFGALALLAWKLKAVLAFLLTKGKLILAGLTKSGTFFSMLLAFGVYWTAFGWKFALGLVVSIYIHEMGHVSALHRLGIATSAPMFIPGVGAFVRMGQYPLDGREDARVGLAGPIWGLVAALVALGLYMASGAPIWGAITRVGAWINLFNLLPVWQLDGSRGFRALSRAQGFLVAATMGAMWLFTKEGLLVLLLIAACWRAFVAPRSEPGNRSVFFELVGLVIILSVLCLIDVPVE
jgi:Zn-dependent protease